MKTAVGRAFGRVTTLAAMFLIAGAIGAIEGYVVRRQLDVGQGEADEAWRAKLEEQADEWRMMIGSWAGDRLSDSRVVASYPAVAELLAGQPAQGGGETALRDSTRRHVETVIDSFIRLKGYHSAVVVDRAGTPVATAGEPGSVGLTGRVGARLRRTAGGLIDLFYTPSGTELVSAAAVSQPGVGAPVTGYVILISDPREWLFPHLLRGPVLSETGEALLVGVEGGRPVYASPLRYPARPLSTHALPTASGLAVLEGAIRWTGGSDYRGEAVLSAIRQVPATPWTLVVKVDRREARATSSGLSSRQALLGLGLLVAQVVFVVAILRRRRILHARQQRAAAEELRFLNGLFRTISEVNELMVREKDRQRLLDETCRIIVEQASFKMSWIGEVRDETRVVPTAWAGDVQGYLEGIDIRIDDTPAGRGPTGLAIRERRTVVVPDVASFAGMLPWRARALGRGYHASAAVPLVSGGHVLGALMVYAGESRLLQGQAIPLIEKLASNLAYALDVIELEARHRETERALSVSEDQLRQAQKMEAIGRLAGGVAHDFNNLLMVISGYAEVATSAKTDESRRRSIHEIATAADRAAALTRQLVAFSRKQVLQPSVLDLNETLRNVESFLRRLIAENIDLIVRPATDLRPVLADAGQIEQVLVNLVVNARDAMPSGGRLLVETANVSFGPGEAPADAELPPGEYVMVSVADSGEGMSSEVLEHLFEPFFTTKETGKGTGLGLSMVYGIVKQSGGGIVVESTVGRGSTFRVYLPATSAGVEEPEEPTQALRHAAGSGAVLVVEDNDSVRGFVVQVLREAGYRVSDAARPALVLDLLTRDAAPFDLLLTDIVLPGFDGYELARRAVGLRPLMKVLYMSGYADNPNLREKAMRTGIDLLEKPFSSAALVARVREVLDRAVTL